MSNGGPHGDKWNPHPGPLTDEEFGQALNTPVEEKYATAAVVNPSTGTLWVANYGSDSQS